MHCDWLIYCAPVPLRRARNLARRREGVCGGRMLRRRLRPGDRYGSSLLLLSSRGLGAEGDAARARLEPPISSASAEALSRHTCPLPAQGRQCSCSCGELPRRYAALLPWLARARTAPHHLYRLPPAPQRCPLRVYYIVPPAPNGSLAFQSCAR